MSRQFSPLDHLLITFDNALKTLTTKPASSRVNPADDKTSELDEQQKKHIAGLMRINHCGEVCAQALYQGQALTAKQADVQQHMRQASIEENDHLNWCHNRLEELSAKPSVFNPLFYAGSFILGAGAGAFGDKWSLGFVAETENQVLKHIDSHLQQVPDSDQKTTSILEQMRSDEAKHAKQATDAGGIPLPQWIKTAMGGVAKIMTTSTYRA